jgi:ABC-2 type transport system ATP-binding protein
MSETILKINGVTKKYKGKAAVDNITMTIRKGDIYGLIGRNGAGKTTLMRMITALTSADSGEIELFGENTASGLLKARRRMGCVVETPALYPTLTAFQNLEYFRILRRIEDRSIVHKTLKTVALDDTGKKKFRDFSLGMKQRLGLAVALLNNPDFIILDEPNNGLDPMGIVEMRELIISLQSEQNKTIMVSSHMLSELSMTATRYGIINNGKLIKEMLSGELNAQNAMGGNLEDYFVSLVREGK